MQAFKYIMSKFLLIGKIRLFLSFKLINKFLVYDLNLYDNRMLKECWKNVERMDFSKNVVQNLRNKTWIFVFNFNLIASSNLLELLSDYLFYLFIQVSVLQITMMPDEFVTILLRIE
jgi:hypothetical protein